MWNHAVCRNLLFNLVLAVRNVYSCNCSYNTYFKRFQNYLLAWNHFCRNVYKHVCSFWLDYADRDLLRLKSIMICKVCLLNYKPFLVLQSFVLYQWFFKNNFLPDSINNFSICKDAVYFAYSVSQTACFYARKLNTKLDHVKIDLFILILLK